MSNFADRLFGDTLRVPLHEGVNSARYRKGQTAWLVNRSCNKNKTFFSSNF